MLRSARIVKIGMLLGIYIVLATACAGSPAADGERADLQATEPAQLGEEGVMAFELISSAFSGGEAIPRRHTCDGEDLSPALAWEDAPEGVASFALIMDDPDAPVGTWVHWVLFNIPATARSLEEGMAPDAQLADGSRHGSNSWGRLGYGGPCPPSGIHRYFFKLYALDEALDLEPGASKEDLLEAIQGHVLAQTELMGTYSRAR